MAGKWMDGKAASSPEQSPDAEDMAPLPSHILPLPSPGAPSPDCSFSWELLAHKEGFLVSQLG